MGRHAGCKQEKRERGHEIPGTGQGAWTNAIWSVENGKIEEWSIKHGIWSKEKLTRSMEEWNNEHEMCNKVHEIYGGWRTGGSTKSSEKKQTRGLFLE